eukprot:366024-Chlamydomonas_euryale.AAC.16
MVACRQPHLHVLEVDGGMVPHRSLKLRLHHVSHAIPEGNCNALVLATCRKSADRLGHGPSADAVRPCRQVVRNGLKQIALEALAVGERSGTLPGGGAATAAGAVATGAAPAAAGVPVRNLGGARGERRRQQQQQQQQREWQKE